MAEDNMNDDLEELEERYESEDEEELQDPNLDPGFSSWNDFYSYMYG